MNYEGKTSGIASPLACAPVQQLNDKASQIIDTLSVATSTANIIHNRLFGCDDAKNGQNCPEPDNLDARLILIRAMSQELENKLSAIQSKT